MQENNKFIADQLAELDVDVFGIGDMSAYDREMTGIDTATAQRLPFAISIGLVLSKAVLGTVLDGPNPLYLHHYRQLNYRLDMVAYLLSREIERKGYRALPFAASQVIDWQNQKGHLSHKHIAVLSGVGWIGRNNLLIHPVYGAHVRYDTILTDMPMEANKPLGRDCGECRACIDRCPAGAIKDEQASFDHQECYNMLTQFKNKRNLGHHICGICIEACKGER